MVKFKDFYSGRNLKSLCNTEQSRTYILEGEEKKVVKVFPNSLERCREELSYMFVLKHPIINVPNLSRIGEDFIEMELLASEENFKVEEIIREISRVYLSSANNLAFNYFPHLDLSKEKSIKRLNYLPVELKRRGKMDSILLEKSTEFLDRDYVCGVKRCLIHGDLKQPHIFNTPKGIFFIDLALMSIGSPWYDLAFLYMSQKDKAGLFEKIVYLSHESLAEKFEESLSDVRNLVKSGIFYRTLYDVVYSSRHRSDKVLDRNLSELNQILSE
jgi:hypothetical protein